MGALIGTGGRIFGTRVGVHEIVLANFTTQLLAAKDGILGVRDHGKLPAALDGDEVPAEGTDAKLFSHLREFGLRQNPLLPGQVFSLQEKGVSLGRNLPGVMMTS